MIALADGLFRAADGFTRTRLYALSFELHTAVIKDTACPTP